MSTLAVESTEDAAQLRFAGSRTVLLDGTDPFAQPGASPARACPLYATPTGIADRWDQLAAALTKHAC